MLTREYAMIFRLLFYFVLYFVSPVNMMLRRPSCYTMKFHERYELNRRMYDVSFLLATLFMGAYMVRGLMNPLTSLIFFELSALVGLALTQIIYWGLWRDTCEKIDFFSVNRLDFRC